MAATDTSRSALAAEVAALDWYHTFEFAPGIVTPGWQDTRPIAGEIPFPSLDGVRCLDVGTFNGFWAFEMERRGAAEVIGIDVLKPERWDWPAGSDSEVIESIAERQAGGRGFEIAKRELASKVERLEMSVYDLDPETVGQFDVVYLGSLLIHLRDPVRALEAVRSVCSGRLILVDGVDPLLSLLVPKTPVARLDGRGRPWWWHSNPAGVARMVEAAGFTIEAGPTRLFIPRGEGRGRVPFHPRQLFSPEGRDALVVSHLGDPHAVIVARPRI